MEIDWSEHLQTKRAMEIEAATIVAASNIMASLIISQGLVTESGDRDPEIQAKKSADFEKAMEVALDTARAFAEGAAG